MCCYANTEAAECRSNSPYYRTIETTMTPLPNWMQNSLQGLVFWVGHRQALFSDHPLPEAALVSEACNLIWANLDREKYTLKCEVMYKDIITLIHGHPPITDTKRADLVVFERRATGDWPVAVVEVKRWGNIKKICDDLDKIASIQSNKIDRYIVVLSESQRPDEYLTEKHNAKKEEFSTKNGTRYKVRRCLKASSSFSSGKKAHYSLVMQVTS